MIEKIVRLIDNITEFIGRSAAFFSVLMVLVTCYIVVTRYIFNSGSIAVQESVTYLNALLFLGAAAFTLKHNGHVRVDIFYNAASSRYKAWVNFLGGLLLLLPVCIFIVLASWNYVAASWRVLEQSGSAGGLAYVYLLKSLIMVMGFTVILQGISEILKSADLLFFSGNIINREAEEEGSTI